MHNPAKEYHLPKGGKRKKGVKYGALVTFYSGAWLRRLYGRIIGIDYAKWGKPVEAWAIVGDFGLSSFHIATVRSVKGARVLTPEEMEAKFGFAR